MGDSDDVASNGATKATQSGPTGDAAAGVVQAEPTDDTAAGAAQPEPVSAGGDGAPAGKRAPSERRRERRERRRRSALSPPLLLGSLLSVAASVLLGWLLMRPSSTPPPDLDPAEIASLVSASVVAQTGAVNALLRHLRRAQAADARRVDFLALGPVGTGKTLLTQVLTSGPRSLVGRRLVGDVEVQRDRGALRRLAGELVAAAPAGGWLLLAMDDVGSHLPETVYLLEAAATAAQKADVRLITLVTATTLDLAGERGAEATREAFSRHSHLLPFRPLRRSGVVACLLSYAHSRGLALAEETAETVAGAVRYEGEFAVNGCKPAIYHLRAALKLEGGGEGVEATL